VGGGDALGRVLAVGQGQWQAVGDVEPDRQDEGLVLGSLEETAGDRGLATPQGRLDPVGPVDDPHRRPVHYDRRQFALRRDHGLDMDHVGAGQPG
jgi:hypothetical protein